MTDQHQGQAAAGPRKALMQGILVNRFGGPEVMETGETAMPEPGPDELLVRVLAAGVGPWDAHLRQGSWTGSLPYIPGGEFAGTVVGDTGADAGFYDGTPVYGYPGLTGCYAQYVTCPIEQLAPIPAGLQAVEAAAVPIDALTAEQGLTDVLELKAGDQVVITAGAGGVGHFAVQIARALGAVVVATASPRNHEFMHQLGAAIVIDHTLPSWPDQVRDATGGDGAERVLVCAEPTIGGAARAARDGAVIATPVHSKELPDARRLDWRPYNGLPRGSRLIRMAPWFDDGTLSVHISGRYFFQDAPAAHEAVEKGHTRGKIVLVVDEDLAAALEV